MCKTSNFRIVFNATVLAVMFIILQAGVISSVCAEELISLDVFHIKRNKNSNLVQYSAHVEKTTCQAKNSGPVYVFWRNLEVSPTDTSNILFIEKPAYGIKSQSFQGGELHLRLYALPEKLISVEFTKFGDQCKAIPYVDINNERAILDEVYVFAKERWYWKPKVLWIEIRGTRFGKPVTEKLYKE